MDYRESHKQSGECYDENLADEPISAYMTKIESNLLLRIIPSLFPSLTPSYLDFACGTGRITSVISPMTGHSYGVDISASMLEKAKIKCPKTEFILTDVTSKELSIEPVDLITSFRFFGNAQNTLRSEVLSALNKLLKKNGFLIINNHRNPWSLLYLMSRFSESGGENEFDLSPTKLKELLNENGFKIVNSYGIATWVFRNALLKPKYLNSPLVARFLEPISKFPGLHLISPDALIIATKTR